MKLAELIGEECVLFDFQSDGKWKAIESILDHLVKVGRVTPEQRMPFLDALVRRETLASTGMDNGVALPHAQVEGLDSAVGAAGSAPSRGCACCRIRTWTTLAELRRCSRRCRRRYNRGLRRRRETPTVHSVSRGGSF